MIINSILVLGLLGLIFAALLALAADYFKVVEDPRVAEILKILPGSNCGACGHAGCHAFAEKLAKGEVPVTGCVAGGQSVADKLAAALGIKSETMHQQVAAVHCGARAQQRQLKANYHGVKTCVAANLVDSGGLLCRFGCLGYGDCQKVCPFAALEMSDGLPVIDLEKCTGCNKCVLACPRQIMALRPYDFPVVIACSSKDKGAETRKICPVGCIACKICEKEKPEVFKVVNNLAVVDYSVQPSDCSTAIAKCPTKCIVKL